MKQKFIILFNLLAVILIAGNLMAQVNVQHDDAVVQKRLLAVEQAKLEAQQNPVVAPKSVDEYCIPSADCSFGDGFDSFSFAGIENLATGCAPGGYGDYTDLSGEAEIGYTYTMTMVTGYDQQMVSMWIDFNDDEEFSAMELVLTDYQVDATGVDVDIDITIPGNAVPGEHRLRVGANWIDPSSPDPCAALTYGEWEDYMINITGTPISYNATLVSMDMAGIMLAGDIVPMATVANMGVEVISFPVTFTTSSGYESTVEVVDLGVGELLQVEFDTWSVDVGSYDAEVCCDLDGDEIPDDDCDEMTIVFSDQPRQKVVSEFFTGTW